MLMLEMGGRLMWFFFLSVVGAYAIFLVAGSIIHAEAVDTSRVVHVRDVLEPNAHHLSGMVMVHRSCDALSVETETLAPETHKLIFTTWQQPNVECRRDDIPRAFRASVVAPAAGATFIATLDKQPLTLIVHQDIIR